MTYIEQICDSYGVVLRREALAAGIDDVALWRLVKTKQLIRLRQGAYALRVSYLAADTALRHLMLCRAVMRQYDDHVALSHASSCLVQGGPEWGLDTRSAHLTHLSGGGRRNSRLVHHQGACRVGDLRRSRGHWVTVPARAVLETASFDGAEAGFVQANHFLHSGEMSREELLAQFENQQRWPGSLVHHPVIFKADGRVESVGESRFLFLTFRELLPVPELQHEISDTDGRFVARADFAWPEQKVVVEVDGLEKYHRFRRRGESIEQMVLREKKREEQMTELGWIVIRVVWSDLEVPAATAARVRRALARGRGVGDLRLGA